MAQQDWVIGGIRRDAAADRIYAAATDLVVAEGLDALDIDALASRVHCSRATVYRYAGGKARIRDEVLMRLAAGVVGAVRDAVEGLEGTQRVVVAVRVALEAIRAAHLRRLMAASTSNPGDLHTNPLLAQLAAELSGIADDDPLAAQWVVRVVLSLAYWPIDDPDAEAEVLRRFLAPGFDDRV